jgi:acetamidase/formamidase
MAGREHVIDPARIHHEWDAGLDPPLAINSGDVVHYDLKVAGEGQVWPGATYPECKFDFDFDTIYNLSGPLWVSGATPGDTLEIEILELTPGSWGWTAFLAGLDLYRAWPQPRGRIHPVQCRGGPENPGNRRLRCLERRHDDAIERLPARMNLNIPFSCPV